MRLVKRDVVLWLRHRQEAGMPVPAGCSAVFRVGDADILFQPMRPGPSGRPTPGLRAAGANRAGAVRRIERSLNCMPLSQLILSVLSTVCEKPTDIREECNQVGKLWGNGSVGGQTLLGVPMLARLRDDDQLRGLSGVWPFETGHRLPPRDKPRIIFAEIYPSLVKLPADIGGRVKDSVQVEAIARHLAWHDASDTLSDLFAAPATLEPAVRDRVETEWSCQ